MKVAGTKEGLRIAFDQVHILMSNVPFRTVARLELGQCHLGCLNFDIILTQLLKYGLHFGKDGNDGFFIVFFKPNSEAF